ncbi:FAD-dependent oxidoreductase [Picrophilus oshimae]|uniref:Electron transfer flavoprotein-quinone oxidoreductase n=1 Tax=Picrophilus torridus (strain ATCC 700027 / DSM 9790 / JCM 10055 / NBRC 100828 / KAW 2/3) TaxID=1122961 RepID=A0A8G2FWF9_PICTO|nr:FAD-dependent oxidoreductase [Picrophilus oshimae]SMD30716.1 electron transfer flavoprotein-quinone oxidoreductase [Picrophilus oshimae DSM 9789]
MDYDIDLAIVGGGLAGLSAAITASRLGISCIVLERGEYSGSKNVSGGRMYIHSLKRLLGDRFDEAPLELPVESERYFIKCGEKSISFSFSEENKKNSYTVLRAKFDRWLSQFAEEAGVPVSYSTLVKNASRDNGIMLETNRGDIRAPLVIEADGVGSSLSRFLDKKELKPEFYMLGIKEIIESGENKTGEANTFIGYSGGVKGGGFMYTNKNSISLGLTLKIESLQNNNEISHELIEKFRESLNIDGKILEYSAHMIPFYGYKNIKNISSENLLVTGDAAGLLINDGFAIRGMDLAIESGMIAAQAAEKILKSKNYGDTSIYNKMMYGSQVMNDLKTASSIFDLFNSDEFFNVYPKVLCDAFSKVFTVDDDYRKPFIKYAMEGAHDNNISLLSMLRNIMRVM